MHDIYSVKLKNVSSSAANHKKYRASYFPYERFYIFHKEDRDSGLIDRMFYVYLLHDLNNIKLQEYIKKYIDIKQVRTIKQVVPHKITDINLETDVKSRLNWHIKDLDQHLLVVPTYARKAKIDKKEYSDESVVGYVRSRIFMLSVEDKLGSVPDLIVGKENLQQPCFFCSNYLEGFQTGACYFGGINCRIGCRIHLPDKNLVINLGEENV